MHDEAIRCSKRGFYRNWPSDCRGPPGQRFHVFGTARKESDTALLQSKYGTAFTSLLMDITDQDVVTACADQVRHSLQGSTLAGLVNNACISLVGPVLHQPIDDLRFQMEVNLIGPVVTIKAFAPLLGADRSMKGRPGRIVNMSSVGGRFGGPFLGACAASKHALEGISESLRRELMLYGVDVILVEPGYVNTPIMDKAEKEDMAQYRNTEYGPISSVSAAPSLPRAVRGSNPQ